MEPAVLYVDDEAPNLGVFRRCLDEQFRVLTADSGPAALEVLRAESVGVLISDQKMEPMTGIELLASTQAQHPLVTRMLLTAFSDRELLLAAIHRGKVDDYLLKPWQADELALRLRQGMELNARRVAAVTERDALKAAQEDDLRGGARSADWPRARAGRGGRAHPPRRPHRLDGDASRRERHRERADCW